MGKELIVEAGALRCLKRDERQRGDKNRSAEVINMRKNRQTGWLEPMGLCRKLTTTPGAPLVITLNPQGERWLIIANGNVVKAVEMGGSGTTVEVGALNSRPLCAITDGYGVTVMTACGAERMRWDSTGKRWELSGLMPEFPPIAIVATEQTTLTATIRAAAITGDYPHGSGRLKSDDSLSLTADCLDAYRRLDKTARAGGYYMQPLIARYRIKDRDGNILYRSAPVIVGDGFQCTGSISCAVSGGERQATDISTGVWKMGITAPESVTGMWREEAATLEILATRQLHPVRMKGEADGSLNQSGANVSTLGFTMPGVARYESGDSQRRAMVTAALDRLDEMMSVVARINDPFGGAIGAAGTIKVIERRNSAGVDSEWAAVEKSLGKEPLAMRGYKESTLSACRVPHRFTATTAAVCGDTVLWGNPTALRYGGYPLTMTAAATRSGRWRANVAVEMADGSERAVWSGAGDKGEPLTLSPLLTYPAADAEKMTINISHSDGSIVRESLRLTPTENGDMAYYLHPTIAPWSPTTAADTYLTPAEIEKPRDMAGRVLSATNGFPLAPTGALAVSPAAITKLTAASRSDSTWDFGRGHYYSFSPAGIAAISVNSNRVVTGANLISTIGIDRPEQVAPGNDGVWTLTDEGIMKISGNRCAWAVSLDGKGRALGWCRRGGGELWVTDADGSADLVATDRMETVKRRLEEIDSLYCDGDALLIINSSGVSDTATETAVTVETQWKARLQIDGIPDPGARGNSRIAAVRAVTIDMDAQSADIAIDVRCDCGQGPEGSRPLLSANVRGAVDRPLTMRLRAPRRGWIDIRISGKVSAESVIRKIILMI